MLLRSTLKEKSYAITYPSVGSTYPLGEATFTIIGPNKSYDDANNNSVAIMLQHGDNRFLFTGDCEEEAEYDMLDNGLRLAADVYQVGHHGSKSSSTSEFMNAVNPTYAVISCGENNKYGHPHAQTLNTLRSMGILVYRTDEQGSLIATSDGTTITWNAAPSES